MVLVLNSGFVNAFNIHLREAFQGIANWYFGLSRELKNKKTLR